MNLLRYFVLLLCIAIPFFQAEALVDYTPSSKRQIQQDQNQDPQPKQKVIRRAPPNRSQSYVPSGMFEVGSEYRSHTVELPEGEEKVDVLKFRGHFSTNYDVFFEFEHWISNSEALNPDTDQAGSSTHQGNPKAIVGFNWLKFGEGAQAGNVDLYGGLNFAASGDSAYGHSRSDKIFGILTTKRFFRFALGLGYELRLTGTPDRAEEMDIGNLQKLYATVGWQASPDIQIVLEGAAYTLKASESTSRALALETEQTFGSLEPRLVLGLSPMIELHLGGTFRTNKAKKSQELTAARLWSINGLYGNSIFAGLNLTL